MSTHTDVERRHCDLLDQAWTLMQGAWDAQPDDSWRVGGKKWRDAYYTLWSEHCGHDPGPAPYGFPLITPDRDSEE